MKLLSIVLIGKVNVKGNVQGGLDANVHGVTMTLEKNAVGDAVVAVGWTVNGKQDGFYVPFHAIQSYKLLTEAITERDVAAPAVHVAAAKRR